jgi:hypothetical protein
VLLCLAPKPRAPRGSLRTPSKRCARPSGRSRRRRFPPKAGRWRPKGWRVPALGVGLSPGPWWLRPLPNVSLTFGLGFFHEVGAKLLVEIRPEGGHRHNSPLTIPPSSEGVTTGGPLGDKQNALLLPLPSLSKLLYITTKLLLLLLLPLSPYATKEPKHLEPRAMKLNQSLRSSLLINVCLFSYKGASIYNRPWGRSNNPITLFRFLTNDFTRF